MRALGLLKQIPLHTSSYLLHVWYMIQPFRIYAHCLSRDDGTLCHQIVQNSSNIYHKWLRNSSLGPVSHWVDLGPTGIFLGMNRLLFDCSTISIFHWISLPMKYFITGSFLIIFFTKFHSSSSSIHTRSPSDEFWHNNLLVSQLRPSAESSWNV